MKEKERPILYISLALNLVLAVLLILSYSREPEPTAVAAIPTTAPTETQATTEPTPTFTPPPQPTETSPPTATQAPTATDTPTPANTPTPTQLPSPTPTNTPVPSPTSTPTPSLTPIPQPDWLIYLNTFRRMVGLPEVVETIDWSEGSRLHSIYMVNNNHVTHYPTAGNQWYTARGALAADFGNIAATVWTGADYIWAINYWMSAPFHGLPILDPELTTVGFGSELASGGNVDQSGINFAATLDIERGIVKGAGNDITFPIIFPPDGGETWILRHSLPEYPDPLKSCQDYGLPSGPPIMIQTGLGDGTPVVTSYTFTENGSEKFACMFHEGSYTNSGAAGQQSGRGVLNARDAVVVIPFNPLVVGSVYKLTITIDGQTYTTEFTAVEPPYNNQ